MDLVPNSEEEQLAHHAADFLRANFPHTRLHAADNGRYGPDARQAFAEQGWFSLSLPEDCGGIGFNFVDEMLLFREGGRQLAPFGVMIGNLAAATAARAGATELAQRLATGSEAVALAVADPNRREARIFEAEGATLALAISSDASELIDLASTSVAPHDCLDKSVTMGVADLTSAPRAVRAQGPDLLQRGLLLTAASLTGIAEATTDMIVEYAQIRETFGRPIGAYQAVRHPCAEMAVRAFAARAELFFAAVALRDGRPDAAVHADASLTLASDAAIANCDQNIQLHGGIATTDEHDAHHFLKRAHLLTQIFGRRTVLERLLSTPLAV